MIKHFFGRQASRIFIFILVVSTLACQVSTLAHFPATPAITPTATSTSPGGTTATPAPTAASNLTPTATITAAVTPTPSATPLSARLQLQVFEQVWSTVDREYLYPDFNGLDWSAIKSEYEAKLHDPLDNQEFYFLMDEMIRRLNDEHSHFLSPDQAAHAELEHNGETSFVGIGIQHIPVPDKNLSTIIEVYEGSPAQEAGLQIHDNLLEVNGESILLPDGTLNPNLRGPTGTPLTLLVQTPGTPPRSITLTRREIEGETPVVYRVFQSPTGKRIGYILLTSFSDRTVEDNFRRAVRAMTEKDPLDGLVIDNRVNSGGSLKIMTEVLSFFLEGPVGTLEARDAWRTEVNVQRYRNIGHSRTLPLVIFVGPNSVSAGEIFPGILSDQKRAYIIGEASSGNVEALSPFEFEDGSILWLATEVFKPANDPQADWEATGIIPDEVVIAHWEDFTLETDPAMKAALKYFDGLK